jgi:uncharacterized protein YcfJ
MNKQLVVGGIVGALAITAISAVAGYRYMDRAEPATKTASIAREECRDELVTRTRETNDPNQIAGTVAGAAAGGYAGNKIQEGMQERNTYQEIQRNCEPVE